MRLLASLFVYVAFTLLSYGQCTTRLINFGNYDATYATGINKYDTVVGWYMTYSGDNLIPKGFRWFGGNSISTSVSNQYLGINDYGAVVGTNGNGAFVGYQGKGHAINYPGGFYTAPSGINNHGMIVGVYYDSNQMPRGFYRDASGFHAMNVPYSYWMTVGGVNDDGVIVGTADSRGFAYYKGQIRYITYPGATQTTAAGINNYGTIVGSYMTQNGGYSTGFILRGTKFTAYRYPGELETQLSAINNRGDVAGMTFSDTENPKGLIRKCR